MKSIASVSATISGNTSGLRWNHWYSARSLNQSHFSHPVGPRMEGPLQPSLQPSSLPPEGQKATRANRPDPERSRPACPQCSHLRSREKARYLLRRRPLKRFRCMRNLLTTIHTRAFLPAGCLRLIQNKMALGSLRRTARYPRQWTLYATDFVLIESSNWLPEVEGVEEIRGDLEAMLASTIPSGFKDQCPTEASLESCPRSPEIGGSVPSRPVRALD